jgi:hypothetical protein
MTRCSKVALLVVLALSVLALVPERASAVEGILPVCSTSRCFNEKCGNDCRYGTGDISCLEWYTVYRGADGDYDGTPYPSDNCPCAANSDQANCDGDSKGDVCDTINGNFVIDPNQNNEPCKTHISLHWNGYRVDVTLETKYTDISSCGRGVLYNHNYTQAEGCVGFMSESELKLSCCKGAVPGTAYDSLMCPADKNVCQSSTDTYPY